MSPVVILPHPATRGCRKHPGEYEIPGVRECFKCYCDRTLEAFSVSIHKNIEMAFRK